MPESDPTPDERFEQAAAAYGGAIPPETIQPDSLLDAYTSPIRSRYSWLSDKRIAFGWLNSPEVNAIAFSDSHWAFVGINWGAVNVLGRMLSMLFCDPRCLPSLGDAEMEVAQSVSLVELLSIGGRNINASFRLPNSPLRENLLHLSNILAADFIFGHELSHLMRGHLLRLKTQSFSELGATRNGKAPPICFGRSRWMPIATPSRTCSKRSRRVGAPGC
jgi:hypothetical protein